MTAQPTITHTWTWDGGRQLPDWLTNHRWSAGQLVIRTPDGDTRPQPGWWLIAWTDGTTTAASPTVGKRMYGPDGAAGRLARAEAATDGELRRQLDAAIAALGRSETELARLRTALRPADGTQPARHVHVTITNPDEYTANRSALSLVDFLLTEFSGIHMHVTTDAREWEQPDPAATQATEATKEN